MDKTQILIPKESDPEQENDKTKAPTGFFTEEPSVTTSDVTSVKLKTIFPGKTDEEFAVINRKFLRDAEPFSLKHLMRNQKKRIPPIFTGLASLDRQVQLPTNGVTAVFGPPKSFKSIFLLNLLSNIAVRYREKHFVFYSYEESREDLETKLINILGSIPFSVASIKPDLNLTPKATSAEPQKVSPADLPPNLQIWQNMLRAMPEEQLLNLAENNNEFKGLKNFLLISSRIHIVSTGYTIDELLESVKLFNNQFGLGGIFIDSLDKVGLPKLSDPAADRIIKRSELLSGLARELGLPVITSINYPGSARLDNMFSLMELGREELLQTIRNFGLIAGIEKSPKQVKGSTGLELNIIGNRNGPCISVNLSFNPQLLKIKEVSG